MGLGSNEGAGVGDPCPEMPISSNCGMSPKANYLPFDAEFATFLLEKLLENRGSLNMDQIAHYTGEYSTRTGRPIPVRDIPRLLDELVLLGLLRWQDPVARYAVLSTIDTDKAIRIGIVKYVLHNKKKTGKSSTQRWSEIATIIGVLLTVFMSLEKCG